MVLKARLYMGGIESDDLNTLARALVGDAEAAEADDDTHRRFGRHVNRDELEMVCRLVLEKLNR